ncbi:MAG: carboxylesterase/lipase family protein, partial [Rubrivivax sp.]
EAVGQRFALHLARVGRDGLPYAAPPTGPLRWREPQPVRPWAGVRAAASFGPACPQKPGLSLEGGGDPGPLNEDCLYLNVWAPSAMPAAPATPRPVMVWLHGGALIFGAGSLALYDGAALARQGVIVVTVNYRLGALGYFVHPALERAAPGGPVNFGLLDQIAALRWVQQNIAAFGGDPQQVTVFGQSAGAQSVLALMASPLARGLFHRAIAQSPYGMPSHSREQARETGVRVADALGLPGARATAAQLRRVPADRFASLEGQGLSLAPSLIIGDAAMPRALLAAFQAKQQAAVPLVIGSNSDETSVALAFGLDPAALGKQLGTARILVKPLYPGVDDEAELGRQVVRDVAFTAFVRRIAVLHAARAPTFRYYFDRLPEAQRAMAPGVAHGGEVTAVFGAGDVCSCLPVALTEADRRAWHGLAERWAAFAQRGRPERADNPAWAAESLWKPTVLTFGPDGEQLQPGFMAQRLNTLILGLKFVGRSTPGR